MGKFDSYFDPPGNDPFCEVCGMDQEAEECICPECPNCGSIGDPSCYDPKAKFPCGLVRSEEQIKSLKDAMDAAEAEAKAEAEYWEKQMEDKP